MLLVETDAGHAQHQGGAARRSSEAFAEVGLARARDGLGHDRADRARCSRARASRRCTRRSMHATSLSVGLNCATGPEFMTDHIRALSRDREDADVLLSRTRGCPTTTGSYLETPESIARVLERFVDEGWVNIVGGCCGTTPRPHPARSPRWSRAKRPRVPAIHAQDARLGHRARSRSTDDNRPVLVGERTNVLGSRKFKRLIGDGRRSRRRARSRARRSRAARRSSTSASQTPTATRWPTCARSSPRADPQGQGARS